jgi:hypothetical protein
MTAKLSISLDNESSMLVSAIMEEEKFTNVSGFFQMLVKNYAKVQGYELIPAKVTKKNGR